MAVTPDPGNLRQRVMAGGFVFQAFVSGFPEFHIHPPLQDIPPAVAARHAPGLARAQVHLAAGGQQVFRDLAAGLRAADHDHRARRQRTRVAVIGGVQLGDVAGELLLQCRNLRYVLHAAGGDHGPAQHGLFSSPVCPGLDDEIAVIFRPFEGSDLNAGPDGQLKSFNVILKISDQFILPPETVRLRSPVGEPRQDVHGVQRIELEGIPALGQPGLADPPALENYVLTVIALKKIADPQACLAPAHYDGVHYLVHRMLLSFFGKIQ